MGENNYQILYWKNMFKKCCVSFCGYKNPKTYNMSSVELALKKR